MLLGLEWGLPALQKSSDFSHLSHHDAGRYLLGYGKTRPSQRLERAWAIKEAIGCQTSDEE